MLKILVVDCCYNKKSLGCFGYVKSSIISDFYVFLGSGKYSLHHTRNTLSEQHTSDLRDFLAKVLRLCVECSKSLILSRFWRSFSHDHQDFLKISHSQPLNRGVTRKKLLERLKHGRNE